MRLLLVLAAALFLEGCAVTELHNGVNDSSQPVELSQKLRHNNFWWGFYESSPPIKISEICKDSRWNKIKTERTIRDVLIGMGTLGIYTPQTVQITCALGASLR